MEKRFTKPGADELRDGGEVIAERKAMEERLRRLRDYRQNAIGGLVVREDGRVEHDIEGEEEQND